MATGTFIISDVAPIVLVLNRADLDFPEHYLLLHSGIHGLSFCLALFNLFQRSLAFTLALHISRMTFGQRAAHLLWGPVNSELELP